MDSHSSDPSGDVIMSPRSLRARWSRNPCDPFDWRGLMRPTSLAALVSALGLLTACGGGDATPEPEAPTAAAVVSAADLAVDEDEPQMQALAYDTFKTTQDGLWTDEGPCTDAQIRGPFDNSSTSDAWSGFGDGRYLLNRHKLCARLLTHPQQIDIELEKPKDGTDDQWRVWTGGPKDYDRKEYWTPRYGTVEFEWAISIYGPPEVLTKTVASRVKVARVVLDEGFPRSARSDVRSMDVTPTLGCTVNTNWATWRCPGTPDKDHPDLFAVEAIGTKQIQLQQGSLSDEMVKQVEFKPIGSGGAAEPLIGQFLLYTMELKYTIANCGGYGCTGGATAQYSGSLSDLRCDTQVLGRGRSGCVFSSASAVMTLAKSQYPDIHAHMLHAFEAKEAPGRYIASRDNPSVSSSDAHHWGLHWAKDAVLTKQNRSAACKGSSSIIAELIASASSDAYSAACRPPGSGATCSCDEFPFASSWEGASRNRYTTSARMLNASENSGSGRDWGAFLFYQRVIPMGVAGWNADDAWIDLKDTVTAVNSGGAL